MKLGWLAAVVLAFVVVSSLVPAPTHADDPVGHAVAVPQAHVGPDYASHQLMIWDVGIQPKAYPAVAQIVPLSTSIKPSTYSRFLGLSGDGRGQTIAIVNAFHGPDVTADLDVFNQTFGLTPRCGALRTPSPNLGAPGGRRSAAGQTPGCFNFSVVYARGVQPDVDLGWALEMSLDVEWAHVVAPLANIVLVEASSENLLDLFQGDLVAQNLRGVSVISNSWEAHNGEFSSESFFEPLFTKVLNVFGAGDTGNPQTYPASSPQVLSVGGTSLRLLPGGQRLSETAWTDSGGGVSIYMPKPAFQNAVNPYSNRGAPDVSAVADPATGVAVYFSSEGDGWMQIGGTSLSTPIWAAIVAVIDQTSSVPLTPQNFGSRIYGNAGAFFDVKVGANGACGAVCTAGPGYDFITGVGAATTGIDRALRGSSLQEPAEW